MEARAKQGGIDYEQQLAISRKAIPTQRFGLPAEFGELCAFLCSAHAGFITGQNIVIDGGNYPGTL